MKKTYQPKYPLNYCVRGINSFVKIAYDLDDELINFLKDISPYKICVITDTNVANLYENALRNALSTLNIDQFWYRILPGEQYKTLVTVHKILEEIWPYMTRDSLIIAFGGGVVGNIAGTVASLIFRNCPFIHIPTTFMAQADSAIGIKQAVNGTYAKNAYGAYHTPLAVFNYIKFLETLPNEQFRNGLAESIKVAVARSPNFGLKLKNLLLKFPNFASKDIYYILEETIYPKLAGLTADPYEKNSLLFLEIGHTIGHAIEKASQFNIHHGAAIAIGMLIEAKIGIQLGITNKDVYRHLTELIGTLSFPNKISANVSIDDILHYTQCDNRRISSGPVYVLPIEMGKTHTLSGIDVNLIRDTLNEFKIDNSIALISQVS